MKQDNFYWLDHVVLACPNLQEGMDYVAQKIGCKPTYGGKHQQFGTHNALLKIGNLTYFEILAPDPDNPKDHLRWMGVDLVKKPLITRFAVKSSTIDQHSHFLSEFSNNHGRIQEGRRKKANGELLTWELTMPLAEPKISSIPFLIDWKDSIHPVVGLESECSIASLNIFGHDMELQKLMENLGLPCKVCQGQDKIEITLNTPLGMVKF